MGMGASVGSFRSEGARGYEKRSEDILNDLILHRELMEEKKYHRKQ